MIRLSCEPRGLAPKREDVSTLSLNTGTSRSGTKRSKVANDNVIKLDRLLADGDISHHPPLEPAVSH